MIVYGKQNVLYILEHAKECICEVYLSKEIEKKLFLKFASLNKPILRVDNKKAQALAKGGNHQGFFLKITPLAPVDFKDIKMLDRILVLCAVTDVGNIGSIVRSAYALGVQGIVISGVKNLQIDGVLRSSVGALLHLPFCIMPNSLDVISALKDRGFCTLGADMDGVDVRGVEIRGKWALFLGSEGDGLGQKIKRKLDTIIGIKMAHHFHSLNVAVCAGILMHHLKDYS